MDYRYGSHTVYQIEYHFVWVTKYRYKVLTSELGNRVRELVRQTCEALEHHFEPKPTDNFRLEPE
jgi:putative transposase